MRRLAAFLLLAAGLASGYQLQAVVVDGGGTRSASGGYGCGMSAGQTVASGWLAGTGYRAVLGFWHRPVSVIGVAEPRDARPGPVRTSMSPCRPNPVHDRATVSYTLGRASDVDLRVFDGAGRALTTIVRGRQEAGNYRVTWDVRGVSEAALPHGVYFLSLEADGQRFVRKVAISR